MSAKANYFKLGLFIICGLVLGMAAIVVLGAGKLLERKIMLETYFDQSVQGVDVGSKVKFRGVDVGRIRTIDFTRNHYQLDLPRVDRRSYVRVVVELSASALGGVAEGLVHENLQQEIENGLRVRLTALGLTGTSYLEVDYHDPQRYPPLPIDWIPLHPYVPSAPSAFSRIITSLEDVVGELDGIEFQSLAAKADQLLEGANQLVQTVDITRVSTGLIELIDDLIVSNRKLQAWLDHAELTAFVHDASIAMAQLRHATANPALTNSVTQLEQTLRRLDQLLTGSDAPIRAAVDNLRAASENLRELSENARHHPAQLLFGDPPTPSRHIP
jgi:phospholipid/cholesterol/gamma-HCH transport system substrate-binding protein